MPGGEPVSGAAEPAPQQDPGIVAKALMKFDAIDRSDAVGLKMWMTMIAPAIGVTLPSGLDNMTLGEIRAAAKNIATCPEAMIYLKAEEERKARAAERHRFDDLVSLSGKGGTRLEHQAIADALINGKTIRMEGCTRSLEGHCPRRNEKLCPKIGGGICPRGTEGDEDTSAV